MMIPPRLSLFVLGLAAVLVGCSGSASTTPASEADASAADSIVAVYADTALTLSDFKRAYRNAHSTPNPASDSTSTYRNFLEQYVNYRLKVRAAREAGLDSLSNIQKEIKAYRKELAKPRLLKTEVYEPLIKTLYERRQTKVDVSHILLRVGQDASPDDTLEAYRQIQAIADSVHQGVSFGDLAYRNSEDPSAQKKGKSGYRGRLGYLQAGRIVQPFEQRMYNVPPDSVSDVFRTKFGYHILKVHDRKPAEPPIRLAHIMVRPDSTEKQARRLLDSLRTELVRDTADFAALAREYSEDRRSAPKGGDLGKVGSRESLPPTFRQAVARLDSVGDVSKVVNSQYGYHLIKLTDRDSLPSYEEAYDDLKEQISDRPRVDRQKEKFARQVRADAGVTVDTSAILRAIPPATTDTTSRTLLPLLDNDPDETGETSVIHLGDSTYTLRQLARHVTQTDGGAELSVSAVLEDFLNENAFSYAQGTLAAQDSVFAAKMKKYREGLLAFQFMEDSVWTAAEEDTAALRRTFQQHRDRYRLPERIRTLVLRAPADSLLEPYRAEQIAGRPLSAVRWQVERNSLVTLDTTLVTDESPSVYQRVQSVDPGSAVGPLSHEGSSLVLLRDDTLPARRKTFEEARNSVIEDYQEQYENEVMSRLRRRYDARTYPERLHRARAASSDQ